MPVPTEKLALKAMRALKEEGEANPSLLKCRTFGEVTEDFFESRDECDRVFSFITSNRLVQACTRENGDMAALPNKEGKEWIESHVERWTLDRRMSALSLVISALGLVFSIFALWVAAK